MFKHQKFVGVLLALSLSASLAGCAESSNYSVDKNYKADPIDLQLDVDTFDPVYLAGFMYPYYHNMVDFTTEPETKNIVTETDFMGRYYPYSYALYEGDEAAQEFYCRLIDGRILYGQDHLSAQAQSLRRLFYLERFPCGAAAALCTRLRISPQHNKIKHKVSAA